MKPAIEAIYAAWNRCGLLLSHADGAGHSVVEYATLAEIRNTLVTAKAATDAAMKKLTSKHDKEDDYGS